MLNKIVRSILLLAILASLAVFALGDAVNAEYFHSRDRYTVWARIADGRVSLLYDGGLDVVGPFDFSWKPIGAILEAGTTTGWQYVEVSVPAWLVAFLLFVGPLPLALRGPFRRWRRRRQGRCLECGYSLTGNVTGICPECGTEVKT